MARSQSSILNKLTNMHKKYRELVMLIILMIGFMILDIIYDFAGIENYSIFVNIVMLCMMLFLVYIIRVQSSKQVYSEGISSELHCVTIGGYFLQSVLMGILFLVSMLTFISALTHYTNSIESIVYLVRTIITVLVTLWGMYKIYQKKFCDELPDEFTKKPPSKE